MYARVVTRQVQSGKSAELVQLWQDKAVSLLKQQKGFKGAFVAEERSTGKGMTISLWESEADATALETSGVYQQLVEMFSPYSTTPPTREYFEVFVQV